MSTDFFKRLVEHAATHKAPEIDWEQAWEANLTGAAVADILNDTLADVDVEGSVEEFGYGAYECGMDRGYHSAPGTVIEPTRETIRIKGVNHTLPLPEQPITMSYSGGGCDGEHGGRCQDVCADWSGALAWKVVYQELRGADLYVVCEGAQA